MGEMNFKDLDDLILFASRCETMQPDSRAVADIGGTLASAIKFLANEIKILKQEVPNRPLV
jgi:hypothetical protein